MIDALNNSTNDKNALVGLVEYPRQYQTKYKEMLDKDRAIKSIVTKLTQTWQKSESTF